MKQRHSSAKPVVGADFERFCALHPEVERLIVLDLEIEHACGRRRYSITGLWDKVRWNGGPDGGRVGFAMNDQFKTFMVRRIITDFPQFAGMFELRPSPEADRWWAQYKALRVPGQGATAPEAPADGDGGDDDGEQRDGH